MDMNDPKIKEAYEAGRKDKDLEAAIKQLDDHQKECMKAQHDVWQELKSLSRIVYIGFGVVAALELVAITAPALLALD